MTSLGGPRRACDACRARKSRCDATSPTIPCTYCTSRHKPCTYTAPSKGPPLTLAAALETRVKATEALLKQLSLTTSTDLIALLDKTEEEREAGLTVAAGRLRVAQQGGEKGKGKGKGKAGEAEGREGSMGSSGGGHTPHRSQSGTSYGSPARAEVAQDEGEIVQDTQRFLGPSSGPALAKHLYSQIGQDPEPFTMGVSLVDHLLQNTHYWQAARVPLPPADLTAALINAFFVHINSQVCLLHRPSFERAIKAGMIETNPSFKRLVFAVLALGSRFVRDARLAVIGTGDAAQHSRGFNFFENCIPQNSLFVSDLFDVQASALAILWLQGAVDFMTCYQACGFMIRAAIDAGIHREQITRWNASPLEDQLRKRAFWLLVTVDRSISSSLDRPVVIHDDDISLLLPIDISDTDLDDWNLRGSRFPPPPPPSHPTALQGFQALVKLERIQGLILRRLYGTNKHDMSPESIPALVATIAELDGMLNEWLAELPDHFRWCAKPEREYLRQAACCLGLYYNAQILLHRQFVAPARSRLLTLPSLLICSNSARSIAKILEVVREHDLLEDAFYWLPLVCGTAGIMLLMTLFTQGPEGPALTSSASRDVNAILEVTAELGRVSNMAHHFAQAMGNLLEVVRAHLARKGRPLFAGNSSAGGSPAGGGVQGEGQRESALPATTDELRQDRWNGMSTFATPSHLPDLGSAGLGGSGGGQPHPTSPDADPVLANYGGFFGSPAASAWGAGLGGVAGASPGVGVAAAAATPEWSVDWNTIGLSEDWAEAANHFWGTESGAGY